MTAVEIYFGDSALITAGTLLVHSTHQSGR